MVGDVEDRSRCAPRAAELERSPDYTRSELSFDRAVSDRIGAIASTRFQRPNPSRHDCRESKSDNRAALPFPLGKGLGVLSRQFVRRGIILRTPRGRRTYSNRQYDQRVSIKL